jgi:hypothetical protein
VALAAQGKTQEAAAAFEAALRISPKYVPALENLARLRGSSAGAAQ